MHHTIIIWLFGLLALIPSVAMHNCTKWQIFILSLWMRLFVILNKRFRSSLVWLFLGIFKECHEVVPPAPFFESCVFDMCATGGEVVALCQAIESYADMCAANGVPIDWRDSKFCRKCQQIHDFFFLWRVSSVYRQLSTTTSLCFV